MRRQIHALNFRDGQPWLDKERLTQSMCAITRIPSHRVMWPTARRPNCCWVASRWRGYRASVGGRHQTYHNGDCDRPERKQFTVGNQYRVNCLPGYTRGKYFIVPEPLAEAVHQLRC